MKDKVTVDFKGKDMTEIISKMVQFLNMFKGINLGESDGSHDQRGKNQMAEKPAR